MPVLSSDVFIFASNPLALIQVLWKPFHYQLPDYPKGEAYEQRTWDQYVSVNFKFAERVAADYKVGDIGIVKLKKLFHLGA